MDASDWIATVAAGISLLSVGFAASQARTARKALTVSKRAADASDTSAQQAKRSADAAEEANQVAARANELAERAIEMTTPPKHDWEIEPVRGILFRLRNRGTETADDVEIDPTRIGTDTIARELPAGVTLIRDQGHQFIFRASPRKSPTELYVRCAQEPEWRAVKLPPRPPTQ